MDRKKQENIIVVILALLGLLLIIIYATSPDEKSNATFTGETTPSHSNLTENTPPEPPKPPEEEKFILAILKARENSNNSENDFQRGSILNIRNREICTAILDLNINGWLGKVSKLSANSDGKGVLSIEVAPNVEVKTWNNSFSDSRNFTLIEPGSKLHQQLLNIHEGQIVRFSGHFFVDNESCLREASLSLNGKLKYPEFIFKFEDVNTDIYLPKPKAVTPSNSSMDLDNNVSKSNFGIK